MLFRQFFDRESSTYTYLLADEVTREAILIDPVREEHDRDVALLRELDLKLVRTIETHVHADHVTGSGRMRDVFGSKSVMSKDAGAGCADELVADGDEVVFGRYSLEARLTPGHTDGCVSFVDHEGGRVFTGDALLIRGCGRTDFQQGDSRHLYQSVTEKLFSLPDHFAVYPGHDYKGVMTSSIGEEKALNPRLGAGKTEDEFVAIMANLHLAEPKKISIAVPANLHCGNVDHHLEGEAAPEWAPVERMPGGVPEIGLEWVYANLGEFRVIDVREEDEFTGPLGHIEGAELVPLGTVEHSAADWNRGEEIVVVCRSGGRSGRAALVLEAMGFDHVVSMRGGMLQWAESIAEASAPVATGACG